jgi:ATP-dependent DNA helicase RecG
MLAGTDILKLVPPKKRSTSSRMTGGLPPLHPKSRERRTTFSLDEFHRLFTAETGYVERKSGLGKKPLQEALVAFSNTNGGVILIGVADDGRLLGRRLNPAVEQEVHDAAADAREVSPPDFFEIAVDGTALVVVAVARRETGVAQTSDGRVLVRRGPRNRALFGSDLLALLQERSREPFDNTDSGVRLADVRAARLDEFCQVYGWQQDDVPEGLYEQGLLRTDGRSLTVAGALFLLEDPPRRFAKAEIELRRYRDEGSDYEIRHTFRGPLHEQIALALRAVVDDLGTEIVLAGAYRQEVPRLPRDVLREAFSNAVAHRRYDLPGQRTVVEIRPDRVVVRSPGGLVEGVRLDRLRSAQAARNDAVISVLRALSLAEDSGRGVDLIEDEMTAALLEPPVFAADDSFFTVTLPLRAVVSREERAWVIELERRGFLKGPDKLVVVAAARAGEITNSAVRDLTRADSTQARESLRRLVDTGVLERHGERGGATYSLAPRFAEIAAPRLDLRQARTVVLRAARQGPLTNEIVRRLLATDAETARRVLRLLVEEGDLEAYGKTRSRRYDLPGRLQS